jgi:uncharacterized membrane protein YgcG
MRYTTRRTWLAALLLTAASAARVAAQGPDVVDNAGFFSNDAVAKARKALGDINTQSKLEIRFETFKQVPADRQADYKKRGNAALADWARARARESKSDIYVNVCKQPRQLEVVTGGKSASEVFSDSDRKQLRDLLVARFKASEFDRGLAEGIQFIQARLGPARTVPVPPAALNAITDHAGVFSQAAIHQANEKMRALKKQYGMDVVIETFPSPGDSIRKQVQAASPEARKKLFLAWVRERARVARADGIYILICRNPEHIEVATSAAARKFFPDTERDNLARLLVEPLKFGQNDSALQACMHFIEETASRITTANFIQDGAKFFSERAREEAAAALQQFWREFHKDVRISTFPSVPPDRARGVDLNDRIAGAKFFAKWAESLRKDHGPDGLTILIFKQPLKIQASIGPEMMARAFKKTDRDLLESKLMSRFGEENYDKGLAEALVFIQETVRRNLTQGATLTEKISKAAEQVKQEFNWMWIVYGLVALIGLWIFVGILRALFGRRSQPQYYPPSQGPPPAYGQGRPPMGGQPHPPAPPAGYGPGYGPGYQQPPAGGGGGGFLSSMLGGMFGGMAGAWIYDKLSGRSAAAPAPNRPPHEQQLPAADTAQPQNVMPADTGYSSAGGDFGADEGKEPEFTSSGADYGSDAADTGGGDFGEPERSATWDDSAKEAADENFDAGSEGFVEEADTSGGDFGAPDDGSSDFGSSGGDFGGDSGGGGDFGGGDAGGSDGGSF